MCRFATLFIRDLRFAQVFPSGALFRMSLVIFCFVDIPRILWRFPNFRFGGGYRQTVISTVADGQQVRLGDVPALKSKRINLRDANLLLSAYSHFFEPLF